VTLDLLHYRLEQSNDNYHLKKKKQSLLLGVVPIIPQDPLDITKLFENKPIYRYFLT